MCSHMFLFVFYFAILINLLMALMMFLFKFRTNHNIQLHKPLCWCFSPNPSLVSSLSRWSHQCPRRSSMSCWTAEVPNRNQIHSWIPQPGVYELELLNLIIDTKCPAPNFYHMLFSITIFILFIYYLLIFIFFNFYQALKLLFFPGIQRSKA